MSIIKKNNSKQTHNIKQTQTVKLILISNISTQPQKKWYISMILFKTYAICTLLIVLNCKIYDSTKDKISVSSIVWNTCFIIPRSWKFLKNTLRLQPNINTTQWFSFIMKVFMNFWELSRFRSIDPSGCF